MKTIRIIVDFLKRRYLANPRKFTIIAGAILLIILIGVRSPARRSPDRTDSGDNTPERSNRAADYSVFAATNKRAIKQFDDALEVVARLHPSNEPAGSVVRMLAAIDSVNWSSCSPDLRDAVRVVETIESGDHSDSIYTKMKAFSDTCDLYR